MILSHGGKPVKSSSRTHRKKKQAKYTYDPEGIAYDIRYCPVCHGLAEEFIWQAGTAISSQALMLQLAREWHEELGPEIAEVEQKCVDLMGALLALKLKLPYAIKGDIGACKIA